MLACIHVTMKSSTPIFFAGITGAALVVITAYAYYLWYVLLFTGRGFHERWTFFAAERYLLAALIIGIVTYTLTRVQLPILWRRVFFSFLALAIALFAVDWIIQHWGVWPSWYHL